MGCGGDDGLVELAEGGDDGAERRGHLDRGRARGDEGRPVASRGGRRHGSEGHHGRPHVLGRVRRCAEEAGGVRAARDGDADDVEGCGGHGAVRAFADDEGGAQRGGRGGRRVGHARLHREGRRAGRRARPRLPRLANDGEELLRRLVDWRAAVDRDGEVREAAVGVHHRAHLDRQAWRARRLQLRSPRAAAGGVSDDAINDAGDAQRCNRRFRPVDRVDDVARRREWRLLRGRCQPRRDGRHQEVGAVQALGDGAL